MFNRLAAATPRPSFMGGSSQVVVQQQAMAQQEMMVRQAMEQNAMAARQAMIQNAMAQQPMDGGASIMSAGTTQTVNSFGVQQ